MTHSAVHGVLKEVSAASAECWLREGRGQEQADKLSAASAHWPRHTAGSSLADDFDLRYVRDTLGHTTMPATCIFVAGQGGAPQDAVNASNRINC